MVQTIVGGLNGSDQTIVGGLNGSDYSWRPKWFRPDYSWRPKSTDVMVKNPLLLVEASLLLYMEKWFRNEMESSINGSIVCATILTRILINY